MRFSTVSHGPDR